MRKLMTLAAAIMLVTAPLGVSFASTSYGGEHGGKEHGGSAKKEHGGTATAAEKAKVLKQAAQELSSSNPELAKKLRDIAKDL